MAKKRASRRNSSPERHRGIGFLFWVCLVGIVIAVGFAARGSIKEAFSRLSRPQPSDQRTGGPSTRSSPAPSTTPRVTIAPLPDAARPDAARPDRARPGAALPGAARHAAARELALRIVGLERAVLLATLRRAGIQVIDWASGQPLAAALRAGLAPLDRTR